MAQYYFGSHPKVQKEKKSAGEVISLFVSVIQAEGWSDGGIAELGKVVPASRLTATVT